MTRTNDSPPCGALPLGASVFCLLLLAFGGCDDSRPTASAPTRAGGSEAKVGPQAVPPPTHGVPRPLPGRWRLATPQALATVRLPLSQILVRYRDAKPPQMARTDAFAIEAQPVLETTRSYAQALALARQLRQQLQASPARFQELARAHSDDLLTKHLGGRMGAVRPSALTAEALDALSEMKPGAISPIIETAQGFYLYALHEAPQAQRVAAERLVIPHDRHLTNPLGEPAKDDEGAKRGPKRTRLQALSLARELAAEAQRSGSLSAVVAAHPTIVDPLASRPTGTWSTHDASNDSADAAIPLAVIAALAIGEVSAPLDGPAGIELYRRIEPQQAPTPLAYEPLILRYDPDAPPDAENSQQRVKALAEQASRELREHPERFDQLRSAHCCQQPIQWTPGFRFQQLASRLERLELGEVAPEPLPMIAHYRFVRRVAPVARPAVLATAFSLPRPDAPDMDLLLQFGDGQMLARASRELAADAGLFLKLEGEREQRFKGIHTRMADFFESSLPGSERNLKVGSAMAELKAVLGGGLFERYRSYMAGWSAQRMIRGE